MPQWVYNRLFILALPCMSRKSRLFRKTKTVPCAENLSKCIRKPLISARQTPSFFHKSFFSVLERHPILQTKSISFAQSFLNYHPKQPFSTTSAALSHPAITYCSPKNSVVLFIFALNPHAVTPEPRTDSKPFRRRFVRKAGFDTCRRKALLKFSSIEL